MARSFEEREGKPHVVDQGQVNLGIAVDVEKKDGSRSLLVPRVLGAIADFCEGLAVDDIRLVQCDTGVTSDETLSPGQLAEYEVRGSGGSDLTSAMTMLADDPNVTACLVITDGDIGYPPEEPSYAVLWVLTAPADTAFNPHYGRVLAMQGDRP